MRQQKYFAEERGMATYMVGYDLNRPGQDYKELIAALKLYSSWWHCLDSTWIIVTDHTAVQVRDHLSKFLDQNDEILVATIAARAAWRGFNEQCSSWLKKNL